MKFEVGSMKSEGGANHAGEFMRRYSPLVGSMKSEVTLDETSPRPLCEKTTILFKLHNTKALGNV
jgi:hypothetical protein